MRIYDAKEKIKHYENNLDYWETQKAKSVSKTEYSSPSYGKGRKQGGNDDKFCDSMQSQKFIDTQIEYYRDKINELQGFVDRELKILEESDPDTRKIVHLRDELKTPIIWDNVGNAIGLCKRQCQRKYKEVMKKGEIKNDK